MITALLYLVGIVVVVVGIAVSIGLHEVGHLVPAKLFGVRVTQYMIGFGHTLFSRTRGETEYGVKLIPLGGYISMVGMFPPAKAGARASGARRSRLFAPTVGENVEAVVELADGEAARGRTASTGFFGSMVSDARSSSREQIRPGEEHRAFYQLPVGKRVIIMLGGPVMNLLLGILFTGIVLMGFGVAQPTTTISSISQCVVPATAKTDRCTASSVAAPAAGSGLRAGDRIIRVDGRAVRTWLDVTTVIRRSAGVPVAITVSRAGATRTFTVTPRPNQLAVLSAGGVVQRTASGAIETTTEGFIGVAPDYTTVQQPASAVLPAVWQNVTGVGAVIIDLPQRLVGVAQAAFGSGARDPNGPVGVVGVGRIAGQLASDDHISIGEKAAGLLGILGGLNIALFVFNLVPLLPLDGGHIVGALWEGVRRAFARLLRRADPGPVDTAKLMPLTFAVAILLGGMSLLLVYADIVRPISLF